VSNIIIKKSEIGQFEKGVFANRCFKKGELVVKYNLRLLSEKEYSNLKSMEKQFAHFHKGNIYLYNSPERHVNHSDDPNTVQDFEIGGDVALRNINEGEEITTNSGKDDY